MHSILPDHGDFSIVPLEEGFSNKVYLFRWHNQPQWVLRIPNLDDQVFVIDRQQELLIWQQLAQQGITAPPIWHNDQGVVASSYLKGETFSWQVEHTPASLSAIVEVLTAVHAQQMAGIKRYDVYQLIEYWLNIVVDAPQFGEIESFWRDMKAIYERLSVPPIPESRMALCHNDAHPKNIIWQPSNRAYLVDWECAGNNDVLFDVAVLAHSHSLDEQQIDQVAGAVLTTPITDEVRQTITHYRQAYVVRELVWLLAKHLYDPQDLAALQWYHSLASDTDFNPYFAI